MSDGKSFHLQQRGVKLKRSGKDVFNTFPLSLIQTVFRRPLKPLHHLREHPVNQSIKLLYRLNPQRRERKGAQILSMIVS